MGFLDILATFDDKRDVTSAAGGGALTLGTTKASDKSYDTGVAGVPAAAGITGPIGGTLLHDIGRGRRVNLVVQVTTALVGATATLKVDFISSANADLSAATVLISSAAIPVATLVVGYRFRFGSIPGVVPQRYVGCQYTTATATFTAGNISAYLKLEGADDHADILG